MIFPKIVLQYRGNFRFGTNIPVQDSGCIVLSFSHQTQK